MITRVTDNMKFNTVANSLFDVQGQSAELMEKISTQKNINRPSDNPIGAGNILNYQQALASIDQYQTNITSAKTSLSLTNTNLSAIVDIVAQAKEIAISQSSAAASSATMDTSATTLTALIDNALSLLNAKQGDSYLFGGSKTDIAPFSATPDMASIGTVFAATDNNFNGTVTSGGAYTGTENKTYAVKIVTGGALAAATYKISADGCKTWGVTNTDLSAPVTLGDGITMTFAAGTQTLNANDLFTVSGYTGGYYRGNDDQLTIQVGKNNNFVYNITGSSTFTAANGPVAVASVVGAGAGLTADDTITLTRGATAGGWTLTSNAHYPDMKITSTSATAVTIDADNDGTNDITMALSGEWNTNNTASFSITTGAPTVLSSVAVHGPGTVDLLTTLNALKSALGAHNVTAVSAQVDDLVTAQTQVLEKQTEAGSKSSSLEITSNIHKAFTEQITSIKSGVEDANLDELIMSYQIQQIAMQASYKMAAQIGRMTIMDYI